AEPGGAPRLRGDGVSRRPRVLAAPRGTGGGRGAAGGLRCWPPRLPELSPRRRRDGAHGGCRVGRTLILRPGLDLLALFRALALRDEVRHAARGQPAGLAALRSANRGCVYGPGRGALHAARAWARSPRARGGVRVERHVPGHG